MRRSGLRALLALSMRGPVGRPSWDSGVATAGPIDPDTGVYDNPPNMMGWTGKSLKPGLVSALNLPVHVGHDATLAALAETTSGPHKGGSESDLRDGQHRHRGRG